jgi:hypothetical protein
MRFKLQAGIMLNSWGGLPDYLKGYHSLEKKESV